MPDQSQRLEVTFDDAVCGYLHVKAWKVRDQLAGRVGGRGREISPHLHRGVLRLHSVWGQSCVGILWLYIVNGWQYWTINRYISYT